MNNIHPFLRQIKDHIIRFCKKTEGRQAAFTAYTLTGVLLVLNMSGILAVKKPTMLYAKELESQADAQEQKGSLVKNIADIGNLATEQNQQKESSFCWYIDNKSTVTRLNISNVIPAYPVVMDSLIQNAAITGSEADAEQNTESQLVKITETTETIVSDGIEKRTTVEKNTGNTTGETTAEGMSDENSTGKENAEKATSEEITERVTTEKTTTEKTTTEKTTTEKTTTEKVTTEKTTKNTTTLDKTVKAGAKKTDTTAKSAADNAEDTVKASDVPDGLVKETNKEMKMDLSDKQLEALQRIVEAEAGGEDIYGKILVANVVLNRVLSDEFPDTVKEVVFQKTGTTYQFSPIKDGRYNTVTVSSSTKKAVKRALKGEDYSKGALYFFARKKTTTVKASWFDTSLQKLLKYGNHEFYGNK